MPNGQVVHMQPLRFKEYIDVMHLNDPNDEAPDPTKARDIMVESISNIIISVDDISDQQMIKEWLASVKVQFLKKISDHIDVTLEWGPEFETTVMCKDCNEQMSIIAPMNPLYFFT